MGYIVFFLTHLLTFDPNFQRDFQVAHPVLQRGLKTENSNKNPGTYPKSYILAKVQYYSRWLAMNVETKQTSKKGSFSALLPLPRCWGRPWRSRRFSPPSVGVEGCPREVMATLDNNHFLNGNGYFLKWWYPQIIHFKRFSTINHTFWGTTIFWKHPNGDFQAFPSRTGLVGSSSNW